MRSMTRVKDRYNHDPAFHNVCDSLAIVMKGEGYTAGELMEAAAYAIKLSEEHAKETNNLLNNQK